VSLYEKKGERFNFSYEQWLQPLSYKSAGLSGIPWSANFTILNKQKQYRSPHCLYSLHGAVLPPFFAVQFEKKLEQIHPWEEPEEGVSTQIGPNQQIEMA
jgi:hypothetical protein